jgi:hypothetical protein
VCVFAGACLCLALVRAMNQKSPSAMGRHRGQAGSVQSRSEFHGRIQCIGIRSSQGRAQRCAPGPFGPSVSRWAGQDRCQERVGGRNFGADRHELLLNDIIVGAAAAAAAVGLRHGVVLQRGHLVCGRKRKACSANQKEVAAQLLEHFS